MKKLNLLFFILFACLINSYGKSNQQPNFKIEGTINADSGKILLIFMADYMPNKTEELTADIKDNKFTISGYIEEPQSVFIILEDKYMSSDFIIEKGTQTISIDINLNRKVPIVKNKIMLDDYSKYKAFRKDLDLQSDLFNQKADSLRKIGNLPDSTNLSLSKKQKALYIASDSTLLKYTEKNPNSEVALWSLIRLMNWSYEPIFESIYNAFSPTFINGYAGRILKEKIQNSSQLSVGKKFPSIDCKNMNGEKLSTDIFLKNKFTLVEFWYSWCGPCRRQFPDLRDLYKQYSNSGFEIVGISVDQIKNKKELENAIAEEELVWKQYWDMDGVESRQKSIRVSPTNFLIDSTGEIIDKNISMPELKALLRSQNSL